MKYDKPKPKGKPKPKPRRAAFPPKLRGAKETRITCWTLTGSEAVL